MQVLGTTKKKAKSFFEQFPLLKHFDYGLSTEVENCLFNINPIETNSDVEPEILMNLADFVDDDPYRVKQYMNKDLEKIFKTVIPDQTKYRKLFQDSLKTIDHFYVIHEFALSNLLIKNGFNPDVVYNYLNKQIQKTYNNESKNDFAFSSNVKNINFDKDFLNFLKNNLSESKALKLIFSYLSDFSNYLDCCRLFKDAIQENPLFNWNIFFEDNYDHNFDRLHNNLSLSLEYNQILQETPNFSLKQREDFVKMNDTIIEVAGEKLKIEIPQFRFDLVNYSKLFSNCIGRTNSYAQDCVKQKASIIGLFSLDGKPRYCIYTEKYSFKEAKGVGNSTIPKAVCEELQRLLTIKPTIPEDFIALEYHFIQGYKYNPEKRSLFVLFIHNPDVIYEYCEVSNDIYEEFSKAESKGAYLNKVIKKYNYEKIVLE